MKASEIVEKVSAGYHRLVLGADGVWAVEKARPVGGSGFMPGIVVDAAEAATATAVLSQMHCHGGLSAWYMPRNKAVELVRQRGRIWLPGETAAVRGVMALLLAEGLAALEGQFVTLDDEEVVS